jgi:spermidine synthase
MLQENDWFTEIAEAAGSAFSLRIKGCVHQEQSPFQTIEVYETETFGHLMVIDGFTMLSTRENFLYHEMLSHPVLMTHPAPKRVAIIGGGDCGTLREVLRHPQIESAVQIDIDERVTRVAEQFFPELTESNNDPRATLLFDDGIRWMREAPEQSLDVIIIDSTDPVGPAEGLFTSAFYRDCHRALSPGGLLVQQSESPLYHLDIIRGIYADTREAGFQDHATLFFPQAIYPSGWWSATIVSRDQSIPPFREQDAAALPFSTLYYTAEIHRAALAQPAFFRQAMREASSSS